MSNKIRKKIAKNNPPNIKEQVWVNAAPKEYQDYYIEKLMDAYIELFGDIDLEGLEAIEERVRRGCTYPVSTTDGKVLEALERIGWPI